MLKSFITTVDAWRFERPLAIALAASATFMVMAMPPEHLSAVPALAAVPAFQPILAVLIGSLLAVPGYVAMRRPRPRVAAAAPRPEEAPLPDEEQGQFAAAEVSLRLRRADRHPDAPVRAPIFASRDLGSPFMEVGASAPPPPSGDAAVEGMIPAGDYAEIEDAAPERPPAVAEEPVAEEFEHETAPEVVGHDHEIAHEPDDAADDHAGTAEMVEPEWPIPDVPAPVAAFAPEDGPAPAPERARRQSISEMMDRLSAGLDRRAAHGDTGAMLQDRAPALRDALDELNRLAARRG